MNIAVPNEGTDLSPYLPDEHGLFFIYHFTADGLRTKDPAEARWTWRSYRITDMRARKEIGAEQSLPALVREAFLSPSQGCHIDFEDDFLYGDLPDLRHDFAEARGLTHFRFAFNETMLIGARKQPLESVDKIRKLVESGARKFRSPAELIEAVMGQSLDGMAVELGKMGDTLDGIEDRIVCDAWHSERQALVDARRHLVIIHRQMATLTNLFRHLDHSHRDDLPDPINDMAARLSHRAHTLHHDGEQLQARTRLLQDELMAKLTEQSNQLLYILSVMTAVLLPMTIISGLFGMNVGGLPLVGTPLGFWAVTAISIAFAGIVYMIVRRLGRV
ncbi:magnesium transporter CorA [Mesorhizobium sp. M1C.F.Ca.ET.193.01.1.1]|uniref:transporter n=2 Tax=Mesorhizobium TaxID=68287 RepID=UPI000FD26F44|nr:MULTISPECIES: transporter [unclassified Mesorhizobium]TGS95710.1 magnesium transporter CorA [bacterium M00.F.Ca.ET.177.01.1.1]TGQ51783.1 magnesium transporter CorA [Mesorhizobium sp. M1C.F.Ca.ET.210.01.1.1]TGQ68017.1 magnesium transporter CorA [Mesorhizobium sp. M1C.F.Ca.ET.212.01.1.1]TGR03102.1 magnesium transporter CorA [Mesorhizobium sp. M1C.F.Ca.ET.204.01.1.1]TGR23640.1 magnesium transporter CorA [Mesorhizobium sp. M1C.F.Ca.ET.196.01.1.1]